MACYRVATGLCGPGGTSIGSITGPVANCPVNEDTCFASHRGEGPVQIRWQFANRSGTPQDLEWFVREQGATADSAYPVVSLNGQQPGVPTPTSLVHVPGNGSATVSVAAWMLGAQALSPTHLQLFARASGDTSAHVLVADRGMYSDETSGVRFAGWGSFVPEGTGPSARMGGTMIFDRQNHRFVLFGGATASDSVNEVWACDAGPSSTWNLLTPAGSGPGPRVGAAAVYDPLRHRMLVVGGDATNDAVSALSLTPGSEAWSVLAPAGGGLGEERSPRVPGVVPVERVQAQVHPRLPDSLHLRHDAGAGDQGRRLGPGPGEAWCPGAVGAGRERARRVRELEQRRRGGGAGGGEGRDRQACRDAASLTTTKDR